ncbi:hypothetical protein U8Q05_05665 [Rhizobium ruizarguesonis]|nr:hypothetical protein U8Q05_05665 [Rhizobium ruizarguesonis]
MRFGTASFAAVGDFIFLVHFSLVFFRLALVRPGLRRFSGRPLRPSGRKPGGLDGRNGLPILPGALLPRRIFLPMILFGEGFRLHYLYCMISALVGIDQGMKSCSNSKCYSVLCASRKTRGVVVCKKKQ